MYQTKNPIPEKPNKSDKFRPQVSIRYEFSNCSNRALTILPRIGESVKISPLAGRSSANKLFITVTYEFSTDVLIGGAENPYELGSSDYERFQNAFERGSFHDRGLTVRYEVNVLEVIAKGTIYVDVLDIVVSIKEPYDIPHHPRMNGSQCAEQTQTHIGNMFNLTVTLVDSSGFFGDKYINIGGEVTKIPLHTSTALADGVYVGRTTDSGEYRVKYYRFDEDPLIPLYTTYAEALANGDELGKLKQEFELQKQKLQIEGRRHETEIADFKAKLDNERAVRTQLENDHQASIERLRRKEDAVSKQYERLKAQEQRNRDAEAKMYEQESKLRNERQVQSTRNIGEWAKVIPPVVSVVSLVVGIWAKANSK